MTYSDFLFAKPSFIGSMARILDLGSTLNTYNNDGLSDQIADNLAISLDLRAVKSDLYTALDQFENEEHDVQKAQK